MCALWALQHSQTHTNYHHQSFQCSFACSTQVVSVVQSSQERKQPGNTLNQFLIRRWLKDIFSCQPVFNGWSVTHVCVPVLMANFMMIMVLCVMSSNNLGFSIQSGQFSYLNDAIRLMGVDLFSDWETNLHHLPSQILKISVSRWRLLI